MLSFDYIKPGARVRDLDPGGIAEIVQIARFGTDALNLVFLANGRVGERLAWFQSTLPYKERLGVSVDGGTLNRF